MYSSSTDDGGRGGSTSQFGSGGAVRYYIFYRNKEDTVKMKGLEIALSYDLGWGCANLAFSHRKTN